MSLTLPLHDVHPALREFLLRSRTSDEETELLLTENGVAVARVLPLPQQALAGRPRVPGQDKGFVRIAADFDDPLDDSFLDAFYQAGSEPS